MTTASAPTDDQARAIADREASVLIAKRFPRDVDRAEAELRAACARDGMAEQAFYQLPTTPPRTGPSVHLMREAARCWGNIDHGSNELSRDDAKGESKVEAFAWDTQTNTRADRTFIAPHARMKSGLRQSITDLGEITNNTNNAASRAIRECISQVLPRWFTELAQDLCRATLERGDGRPLPDRITDMVKKFDAIGISQEQLEQKLKKKRRWWAPGDLAIMSIDYTSITRDNLDKTELFPDLSGITAADIMGTAEQPEPTEPPAPKATEQRANRTQRTRRRAPRTQR